MGLNQKQRDQLLKPINAQRVQKAQGMSHVAGYDVAAHLTRIFGFGNWEKHITSLELVAEDAIEKGGRTGWNVTYKCQMTLVVKDPSGTVIWTGDDAATGSASNLPVKGDAHDFAVKNAVTYALKRCAKDWGDQFGLSLYNKGSLKALVGATLDQAPDDAGDVQSNLPELHPDAEEQPGEESQDAPQEAAQAPAAQPQPPAQAAGRQSRQQQPVSRPARQQPRQQVRAPENAETDLDWMRRMIDDLIPSATTKPELLDLWEKTDAAVRDGKCTDQDAKDIRAMVTQRADELGFEKKSEAA